MAAKSSRSLTLLTPTMLNRVLNLEGAESVKVLDCSVHDVKDGRDEYKEFKEKHIPGAVFFDLKKCSDTSTQLPFMVPQPKDFENYVGSLGINNDSNVIAYDNAKWTSTRVWWLFRYFGHKNVSVLEGGLSRWVSEGFDVTSGESAENDRKTFSAKPQTCLLKNYDDIMTNLDTKEFQLVDTRSAGRYNGTAPEPREGIKSGSIKDSVNLPYTDLLSPDLREMKPNQELEAIFQNAKIDCGRDVTFTCGQGMTACTAALAWAVLGRQGALYDGSWAEWWARAPRGRMQAVPED